MSVYFNPSSVNNPTKANHTMPASHQSTGLPSTIIITIIVITVGLLLISCVVFIVYMRRSKKRRQDSSSFTSSSQSSSQDTIKDLPSRPVQTITIPSGELKPIKSSVFVWKDSNRKHSANNTNTSKKIVNTKASMKAKPKIDHKINKNIAATKGNTNAVPMTAQNKQLKVKPVAKTTQNLKPNQQNAPKLQKKTIAKPKVFNKK